MKDKNSYHAIFVICLVVFSSCVAKKNGASQRTSLNQLKVLCYNIHHANPPSKKDEIDLDAIARVIIDSKADVVALQEVDKNIARSGTQDQAKLIGEKVGMNYHFFKAIDYDGGEYGVAILSKFPLKEVKSFTLPQKVKAESRILAQVVIQVGVQEIIFANTHLDATRSHENRNAQMQFMMDLYKDTKLPIIICGDFNSLPQSEAVKLLDQDFKRTCLQNCPTTFPQVKPNRIIDYVATKNLSWLVVKHEVIEETYASDHRPLLVTFKTN